MVVEHFDLKTLIQIIKSRECVKKYPLAFWGNFLLGAAGAIAAGLFLSGFLYYNTPLLRPTLQLMSDTVPAGGRLGFIQTAAPIKICPQENARVIWRWATAAQDMAEVYLLSDANAAPRVWDGPTVVYVTIPADIPPGTYHYMRETTSWCSWFNFLFFRPYVERTPSVRFEVVSRQVSE